MKEAEGGWPIYAKGLKIMLINMQEVQALKWSMPNVAGMNHTWWSIFLVAKFASNTTSDWNFITLPISPEQTDHFSKSHCMQHIIHNDPQHKRNSVYMFYVQ